MGDGRGVMFDAAGGVWYNTHMSQVNDIFYSSANARCSVYRSSVTGDARKQDGGRLL